MSENKIVFEKRTDGIWKNSNVYRVYVEGIGFIGLCFEDQISKAKDILTNDPYGRNFESRLNG